MDFSLIKQFSIELSKQSWIALGGFTLLCDCSRKFTSLSEPIRCKTVIFSLLWLAVLIALVLVFQNLIKKCSNWEWKNRCKVQENLVWYTVTWNIQMRNICFSTRNQILYRFAATLNFWLPIRVYKNLLLNLLISSCLANLCQVYW